MKIPFRTLVYIVPNYLHFFACVVCLANVLDQDSYRKLVAQYLSIPTRKLNFWRCATTQSIYTLRRSLGLPSVDTQSIYQCVDPLVFSSANTQSIYTCVDCRRLRMNKSKNYVCS